MTNSRVRDIYNIGYRLARVHPEIMFEDLSSTDAFTQGIKSRFQHEMIMDRYYGGHWMIQRECVYGMTRTAYWWRLTTGVEMYPQGEARALRTEVGA